ncbi:MAG: putative sterol methyltransferase [Bryobacterales bacterium]|nr:putative sterol methyltransferase [Bryobacterales bacterium]
MVVDDPPDSPAGGSDVSPRRTIELLGQFTAAWEGLIARLTTSVDLYDGSYSQYSNCVYEEIRAETYGLDLGQTGWMTSEELSEFSKLLQLNSNSNLLEVGCGAGGCAIFLAQSSGSTVTGIDINENGIRNASALAESSGLAARIQFKQIDAGERLPFVDESFDAVFSNDAMCHIEHRLDVLKEWRRVLKPDGRIIFTDAMVITGIISNEEIATRSSIGRYLFLPPGENERLIASSGLHLLTAGDVTASVENISERWKDARAKRRDKLIQLEGEPNFLGLQRFLDCVHTVSQQRRLSRFSYLASRERLSEPINSTSGPHRK